MATLDVMLNCSDEELLTRCRKGRWEAFDVLVRRYERELYGYLRRYVGDGSLAEDVFQNTFLQLYTKIKSYEPGRPVRPWLYTIATHQAIDALRRNSRHQAVSLHQIHDGAGESNGEGEGGDLAGLLEGKDTDPLDAALASERGQAVREGVDRLPEFLRQVVILGYYQGLKYQEMADVLGIPLGTVKSRLHAALQKLQEIWKNSPALHEDAVPS